MNFRNVLLFGIFTVAVSMTSAFIAVRLFQKEPSAVENTVSSQQPPSPVAMAKTPVLYKGQPQIPPPPPPPAAPPQQKTGTPAEANALLAKYLTPKEYDSEYDARKPIKPEEAKHTLLKAVPACGDDYEKLCLENQYMSEHPMACLRAKKQELSGACFGQLRAAQDTFRKACGSDIQRFCDPKLRHYFPCLKKKMAELSANCRANIQASSR
ncbi:hypothetical protein QJS83_13805 [Bdellovibrio sp. 22V]|uniref:hypothetical protein n=1 Tax=Bdellovibrio sp. 22V TaxID=3044166 RepID=UPI002542D409|nr:hypothetical protein [Bdellovibrio sp. 22V]WII71539.1 hypothetical protein QJS83_13805 [Bdellovibrio sp. 22V]